MFTALNVHPVYKEQYVCEVTAEFGDFKQHYSATTHIEAIKGVILIVLPLHSVKINVNDVCCSAILVTYEIKHPK
jgi:hypothetical protein